MTAKTEPKVAAVPEAQTVTGPESGEETQPCSMREFLLYFLRLGTFGFGGPIALAGHMQRDLVERRRWVSKQDYLEGLALSQLSPGPLAAQLAMYLGWVRAGRVGATLVAAAFILPSFLMVMAISILYVQFHGLPWIQNVFYGIGAAVIAIIARSAVKLGRMTVGKDPLLIFILVASALVTAWTEKEILWVFLGFGLLALIAKGWLPSRKTTTALSIGPWLGWLVAGLRGPNPGELWRIAWYFTEAGAFVFGSGLAIVPFLHGGVVDQFHWLDERQFLDAVAVAMITHPGTGGHYRGVHRLPRIRPAGCRHLRCRSIPSPVCGRDVAGPKRPALVQGSTGESLRCGRHRSCRRGDWRGGVHSRQAIYHRCTNGSDWSCHFPGAAEAQESARANRHCGSGGCRTHCEGIGVGAPNN